MTFLLILRILYRPNTELNIWQNKHVVYQKKWACMKLCNVLRVHQLSLPLTSADVVSILKSTKVFEKQQCSEV